MSTRTRHPRRRLERGITLIEVMVAIGILAMVAVLLYGALDGMAKARQGTERIADRYHQGRSALTRMSRELEMAFVSLHIPVDLNLQARTTAFIGSNSTPFDRVDFASFSHTRMSDTKRETDQNELSYYGLANDHGGIDLVRREATVLDLYPERGGIVQVLAEDVESFELSYLDPLSNEWKDTWDTTQLGGDEPARLPSQVKIELVLRRQGETSLRFVTKVPIQMQAPLIFGVPR